MLLKRAHMLRLAIFANTIWKRFKRSSGTQLWACKRTDRSTRLITRIREFLNFWIQFDSRVISGFIWRKNEFASCLSVSRKGWLQKICGREGRELKSVMNKAWVFLVGGWNHREWLDELVVSHLYVPQRDSLVQREIRSRVGLYSSSQTYENRQRS